MELMDDNVHVQVHASKSYQEVSLRTEIDTVAELPRGLSYSDKIMFVPFFQRWINFVGIVTNSESFD